jgi:hypothetical protein
MQALVRNGKGRAEPKLRRLPLFKGGHLEEGRLADGLADGFSLALEGGFHFSPTICS